MTDLQERMRALGLADERGGDRAEAWRLFHELLAPKQDTAARRCTQTVLPKPRLRHHLRW